MISLAVLLMVSVALGQNCQKNCELAVCDEKNCDTTCFDDRISCLEEQNGCPDNARKLRKAISGKRAYCPGLNGSCQVDSLTECVGAHRLDTPACKDNDCACLDQQEACFYLHPECANDKTADNRDLAGIESSKSFICRDPKYDACTLDAQEKMLSCLNAAPSCKSVDTLCECWEERLACFTDGVCHVADEAHKKLSDSFTFVCSLNCNLAKLESCLATYDEPTHSCHAAGPCACADAKAKCYSVDQESCDEYLEEQYLASVKASQTCDAEHKACADALAVCTGDLGECVGERFCTCDKKMAECVPMLSAECKALPFYSTFGQSSNCVEGCDIGVLDDCVKSTGGGGCIDNDSCTCYEDLVACYKANPNCAKSKADLAAAQAKACPATAPNVDGATTLMLTPFALFASGGFLM